MSNFVGTASNSMERYWQQYENKFHAAFKAIDDGSLLSRPDHVAVVRDMVAVHYVRSVQAKRIHLACFEEELDRAKDFWRRYPEIILGYYFRHTGVPCGPEALERGLDLLFKDIVELMASGAILRERMEDLFPKARAILDPFEVEIWSPAVGAGEFLIGDTPAIPVDPHSKFVGLTAAAAILSNDVSMYLPVDPEHMVRLHRGDGNGFRELQADMVDRLNAIQILVAEANAFARPGTSFEAFGDSVRKGRFALEIDLLL